MSTGAGVEVKHFDETKNKLQVSIARKILMQKDAFSVVNIYTKIELKRSTIYVLSSRFLIRQ